MMAENGPFRRNALKIPQRRGRFDMLGIAVALIVISLCAGTLDRAKPQSRPLQGAQISNSSANQVLGDCGIPNTNGKPNGGVVNRPAVGGAVWDCTPPYETPTYRKPLDDGIAFRSLLEASGYTSAANSGWVGVAAGNFCGSANKQLVLVQNQAPTFSIMDGPAPHSRTTTNLASSPSDPWVGVAAGNLDADPQDEIVALRKVTGDGVPDLIVAKATPNCGAPVVIASATIGGQLSSGWVGAAIGNFDGNGRKIALLNTHSSLPGANLFLVQMQPNNTLQVVYQGDLPKDGAQPSKWKAIAAGDLDQDGIDELIVARQESDSQSATVFAYKLDAQGDFRVWATSTFGNKGESDWSSAAAGDFNADGRQAVVLVQNLPQNRGANFLMLDFPTGAAQLRTLARSDLDSVPGQLWTGLAATDWITGDLGAAELVAVRAVHRPNRTNIFVYGDPFIAFHETLL